eukprot:11084888-Lingulodinium_polyedra.AAC.1
MEQDQASLLRVLRQPDHEVGQVGDQSGRVAHDFSLEPGVCKDLPQGEDPKNTLLLLQSYLLLASYCYLTAPGCS